MHQSLKLKLQHAVNQAAFADADSPALIVGGRRRNRKKRKNKNGQTKRKQKKGAIQEAPKMTSSITPDFEYFKDYVPKKATITCVDIEEPMFVYEPASNTQTLFTGLSMDSLYNSNERLDSSKSRHDSGCESEAKSDDEEVSSDENNEVPTKTGLPRAHSQDSGVYDDSFEVESVDVANVEDEPVEDATENETNLCNLKDEIEEAERNITSTDDNIDDNNFEEIDLTDNKDTTELPPQTVEQKEIKIITALDHISDTQHFLNLIEGEDDIIFDITQLELNTTQDDISNISKNNFQLKANKGSNFNPTALEDEAIPHRFPMDLLIDDDKEDEVLFDAHARKELSITCNPLYEQSLKDEDERVSIKSYQSGFQTNFDNVHYIRIPGAASNQTAKESSRLLRSQRDEDIACCVIL